VYQSANYYLDEIFVTKYVLFVYAHFYVPHDRYDLYIILYYIIILYNINIIYTIDTFR